VTHSLRPVAEARILVVEDDAGIASGLQRALTAENYLVVIARTGAEALRVAAHDPSSEPDLVLLDLGLPDGDGLDVCRRILEAKPAMPIIVLTARTEELDVVMGLDAGAVDYVTKPFRLAELLARLRAHLRRVEPDRPRTTIGPLELDAGARRAWFDGTPLELRAKEFDLLAALVANAGRVMRRDELMRDVWDENYFGSTKTLDVHMAALRRKLGGDRVGPGSITTLRGVGYRLERS
jgi:DNA-binding response OmpR family regulator